MVFSCSSAPHTNSYFATFFVPTRRISHGRRVRELRFSPIRLRCDLAELRAGGGWTVPEV